MRKIARKITLDITVQRGGDGVRELCDTLVKAGREYFEATGREPVFFTDDEAANALANDLADYPHAFVLACCMDRQLSSLRAWAIPQRIREELGGFSMERLLAVSLAEYTEIFERRNLHRFNAKMAEVFHNAVHKIQDDYSGDASVIWADRPSSAAVVCRFLDFDGVGIKIATMAANILARQFKIPFSDYASIDISPDVHVRRIMYRAGLIPDKGNTDYIIYKAREICPEYPGIFDHTLWKIGQDHCHDNEPECSGCLLCEHCPRRIDY